MMKSALVLTVLLAVWGARNVAGSECGESTIPYSLEVLPSGQPILGCARPTCFGYLPNGHQLPTTAKFFRIDQQSDGFLRDDPFAIHPFDAADPRVYAQQQSSCEKEFQSLSCSSEDQWIGGIAPVMNATSNNIVAYQCCTYQPLRASIDRGVASVSGGQIVIGGEVKENGKQYAFDYISNIEKKIDEEGGVYYDVNIRRLSCLDLQNVDRSIAEVLNAENIIRHVNGQKPAAHQVPNAQVGAPITLTAPEGVVDGQEVIIEEIVAQPGFIQPETSTTPVPPPAQGEIQPGNGFQQPFQQGFQQPQGFQPQPQPFQQGFQPQPFQQGFQPQGFQPIQPVQLPAAPPPSYGGVPIGFSAPAGLQLYYCFPGDVNVSLAELVPKRMDEVEIGDWIMTLNPDGRQTIMVQVVSWLHRDPEQVAEFIEFYLDNGKTLTLTEKHLVYLTNCPPQKPKNKDLIARPTSAEKVEIGDCLYIAHPDLQKERIYNRVRVLDIKNVVKTGIYAPMTSVGHLLVNKIHVSCNSETDNFTLQRSFFKTVLEYKTDLLNYLGFGTEIDKENGIGYGANALLEVLDLLLPLKMISM